MTNKVAIVTGGTRGIGRSISLALAQDGSRVYALYARNSQAARALEDEAKTRELDIRCLRGDLTDEGKLLEIVDKIKSENQEVHTVVHAAASGVHRSAFELSKKHLTWTFETNVVAIHELLRHLLPLMNRGGRVIGITSGGGDRVIPFYSAVGASKGSLNALFRHYAVELAPRGINVNLICPGMVLTEAVEAFPEKESRIKKAIEATPTGRLTTPEDVGNIVNFLCSKAADQMVGQMIVLDGGKTLHC